MRWGGYACTFGHRPEEMNTFTCGHCNRIVMVKPKCDPFDLGGLCRICSTMICPACVNLATCDPLEAKLARAEAAYEALRSYGLT